MSTVLTSVGSECFEPTAYLDPTAEWASTHRRNGQRRTLKRDTAQERSLREAARSEYEQAREYLLSWVGHAPADQLVEALDALTWLLKHPTFHAHTGQFREVARYAVRRAR